MAIKICMLNVGDADAIVVQIHKSSESLTLLVDGGKKEEHADKIITHLRKIDCKPNIVICTHLHQDHIGGLRHVLAEYKSSIDQLWVHNPLEHDRSFAINIYRKRVDEQASRLRNPDNILNGDDVIDERLQMIHASVAGVESLVKIARGFKIKVVAEPFSDGDDQNVITLCKKWGIEILGPSRMFYASLVPELLRNYVRRVYEGSAVDFIQKSMADPCSIIGQYGDDTPENESSLIFSIINDGRRYLFTGDAGIQALGQIDGHKLRETYWLKVPHHGSDVNLNCALIEQMRSARCFISASGDTGHPSSSIKNCLGRYGQVLCTGEEKKDLIEG